MQTLIMYVGPDTLILIVYASVFIGPDTLNLIIYAGPDTLNLIIYASPNTVTLIMHISVFLDLDTLTLYVCRS